jgi:hypothetical protein
MAVDLLLFAGCSTMDEVAKEEKDPETSICAIIHAHLTGSTCSTL